jgi:hypothetical protein
MSGIRLAARIVRGGGYGATPAQIDHSVLMGLDMNPHAGLEHTSSRRCV